MTARTAAANLHLAVDDDRLRRKSSAWSSYPLRMRHLGNYKLLLRATLRGEVWKSMPLNMPALELHVRELPAEQTFEVTCLDEPLQVVLEALRRP